MADYAKTPAIRFAGFTDAWEQRKLGEIVDVRSGRDYKHLSEGTIPVYGTGGYMLSVNEALSYDEDAIGIGRKGTIDKPYVLKAPFWTVDTLFYAVPSKNVDLHFAFCIFQNVDWKKKDESTGVPSLSKTAINSIDVITPPFKEQQEIGGFFRSLDDLITLHQRKYDKLMNIKKSMLEKMFPRDGANVPEIRFAGFTDAWEQRKLKDICSVFTDGDWIESKDQSDQGVRLIQTGNVGVTEYLDKPNNKKWVSEDTFERLHCTEVLSGDILISRLPEPAGRACIVPKIGQKMITAVDCTIARIAPEYSSEYVVQYLSTQDYFDEVNNCLAGGTRQRISRGNLSSFLIPLPCSKAEQERIGGFFRSLDDLITLHQREHKSNFRRKTNVKQSTRDRPFLLLLCSVDKGLQRGSGP